MKITHVAILSTALLFAGCATTSIKVTSPSGLKVEAKFPKNLQSSNLNLTIEGIGHLKADHIITDASSVISAKGHAASGVTDSVGAVIAR